MALPSRPRRPRSLKLNAALFLDRRLFDRDHLALHLSQVLLDRGNRTCENSSVHGHVDAFTEVVDPRRYHEHNCYEREYCQQVAVPLEVSTLDVKMHGLSFSAGSIDRSCCS
jgi:hypothetical protein